jgi:hypothetical protein
LSNFRVKFVVQRLQENLESLQANMNMKWKLSYENPLQVNQFIVEHHLSTSFLVWRRCFPGPSRSQNARILRCSTYFVTDSHRNDLCACRARMTLMTAVPMTLLQTFVKHAQVEFEIAHLIQTCALANNRPIIPVIMACSRDGNEFEKIFQCCSR